MAKGFSSNDAKFMIAEHEELYKALCTVCNTGNDKLIPEIRRISETNLDDKQLTDQFFNDLRLNNHEIPRTRNTELLAVALYRYIHIIPIVREAERMVRWYGNDILNNISLLQNATSKVKWLFSSGKTKAEAESAYLFLGKLLKEKYRNSVLANCERIAQYDKSNQEIAFPDFDDNIGEYKNALLECCPDVFDRGRIIQPIEDILDLHRNIEARYHNALSECEQRFFETEQNVHKAVENVLANLTLQHMRDYDVETLSQKRPGIRTKLLRSAGYETVADVYIATTSNLASIYGISFEAAWDIKEAAKEICEALSNGLHLKISSDEQSQEVTELLAALYNYRHFKSLFDADKSEYEEAFQRAKGYAECLNSLKNNLCWVMATKDQKGIYSSAFLSLSNLFSGWFADKVESFAKSVFTPSTLTHNQLWKDFTDNSISYYNTLEELVPGILGNGDMVYGLPEDLAREIQDQTYFPQGLKVTLRRYQEWGVKYILHQEKVLLGDEMGLGKTVQAIATMVSLRNTGSRHFMVVCPASVLPNWCKEVDKKSEFFATKVHGYNRQSAIDDWVKSGGVAITTYETTGQITLPDDFQYDLLVVDEAHYIKNENAQRSKNVRNLGNKAKRLLFMTGTALENNVNEMISLIHVLQPGIASQVRDIAYLTSAPQFREKIAPVYYRRKREDVLTELPDITESKEWCALSPEEEDAYEAAIFSRNQAYIRKVSWNCDDLHNSSKAMRMLEIIADAEEDNRKVLVFSFYLETIQKIRTLLDGKCTQPINGSVPPARRQEIIDEFDNMPAGSVLLAQIQAGGTGLNIQSASVVIICEPQLKPSIENQAISRAYRMGQTRKVLVYRLLAADTIDERLDDLLEEKQEIFNAFADRSVAADATQKEEQQIDDKTFGKLILEEIDRINSKNGRTPAEHGVMNVQSKVIKADTSQTTKSIRSLPNTSHPAQQSPNTRITGSLTDKHSSRSEITNNRKSSFHIEVGGADRKPEQKATTDSKDVSFISIDELIAFLNDKGVHYVDNRPKNGCLWIDAEGVPSNQQIRVGGKKLMFSKASKALGGNSGWYIS